MHWPKLNTDKIKLKVFEALGNNETYLDNRIFGVPESILDASLLPGSENWIRDYPFLAVLAANPNHIGCHTLQAGGDGIFSGTLQIERDLVRICAEEIFKAAPKSYDGYVASGGTEANMQALWVYRNYFMRQENAVLSEIGLVYSEDSHYSISKAADVLGIEPVQYRVDRDTRTIDINDLERKLREAVRRGINYFIVVVNVSTVMFGSIDDVDRLTDILNLQHLNYRMHVDACFGGFIYPFTNSDSRHNFLNPNISSIAMDASRILQAPFGTGIFLARKNLLKEVVTGEMTYFKEFDHTLCGSRSGAPAVAAWILLHSYGSTEWTIRMNELKDKTISISKRLKDSGISYYHNPYVNSIAIKAEFISPEVARKFYLVPDSHHRSPAWYKITVMPQTSQRLIEQFLNSLTP